MEGSFYGVHYVNQMELASVLYPFVLFILFILTLLYLKSNKQTIFLVDFACCKPPSSMRAPFHKFVEHSTIIFKHDPEAARFQVRVLEKSGLGDDTCLPPAIHLIPPQPNLTSARDEAQLVMFTAIDDLFCKTGLEPKDIGILVTNCSLFGPSPSFSSIIVNKYKMRDTIKTFSLAGMGCSASPVSLSIASNILQSWPNTYALVVSTEIITPNCYLGSDRSMQIPACLFRMGSTAILLTNKPGEMNRAKYKLRHIIRAHLGSNDEAHNCMLQKEDAEGIRGVSLPKDLMVIATEALESNLTSLGPLVLPMSEKVKYLLSILAQKFVPIYVPDFKKAFDHFCIHTGGPAVINGLEKIMRLSAHQVEASRMSLHRFGNTSSSSIWYVLSYIEAKGMMKKGDRVWQITFGSGFKCNSLVWLCNRDVKVEFDGYGPWSDCIDKYPVDVCHFSEILL